MHVISEIFPHIRATNDCMYREREREMDFKQMRSPNWEIENTEPVSQRL